ncbi:Putative malate transporter YflS [Campylobacter jejuni]|nr:Putative malate transporter YflS [Campylobacter jejuni]
MDRKNPLVDSVYLNCSCFDFMFVFLNTLVCFLVLVMMATWGNFHYDIFKPCFFNTHYFFASITAHISAMFFVFYSAELALGAQPLLYAFIMIASGNVMMALTHYATGTAPVIFGTDYVTFKKWWSIGFVISIVDIVVMITVGFVWWKILGFC